MVFGVMVAIVDIPSIVQQHEHRWAFAAANGVALIVWALVGFCIGTVVDWSHARTAMLAELDVLARRADDVAYAVRCSQRKQRT